MSQPTLDSVLMTFGRQIRLLQAVRVVGLAGFVGALLLAPMLPQTARQLLFVALAAAAAGWVMLVFRSIRLTRQVQAGSILMSLGRLDEAEIWLIRGVTRFSLSMLAKFIAAEQFAALQFRRRNFEQVVRVCRAVLAGPVQRFKLVWLSVRILLADVLLRLDRLIEAHEALLPVYGVPMSLEARLRLLPVQLRYELAAGHSGSATAALKEKVQLAELMDSAGAALVHGLLAEACRRENLGPQAAFLTERAWLYHDLQPLAEEFPVLANLAEAGPPQVSN